MFQNFKEKLKIWSEKARVFLIAARKELSFYGTKKGFRTAVIAVIIVGVVLFIDMLSKGLVYDNNLQPDVGMVQSDGKFIGWRSQFHTSTTFLDFIGGSMPHGVAIFLDGLIIAILVVILYFSRTTFMTISASLTLGGVFGNTFDAMIFSGVRNCMFLPGYDNGTFNFADLFIMSGSILTAISLVIYIGKTESHKAKEKTENTNPETDHEEQEPQVDQETGEIIVTLAKSQDKKPKPKVKKEKK